MKIIINNREKKIKLDVKKTGFFSKGFGLMFRSKDTDNLLFEYRKDVRISITSFFVFFPFLAIWLDGNNKVIDIKMVKPFQLSVKPKNKFRKIVEIPVNNRNLDIIKIFSSEKEKGLNRLMILILIYLSKGGVIWEE